MPPKKFKLEDCAIPQVWCGESKDAKKSKDPLVRYTKTGSRYECLKKGFGAGSAIERKENLPASSMQQIKYIGEVHEKAFVKAGIATLDQLKKQMGKKTEKEMEDTLKRLLKNKDGKVDGRAYNSVIVHLYQHGVGGVPACVKL